MQVVNVAVAVKVNVNDQVNVKDVECSRGSRKI